MAVAKTILMIAGCSLLVTGVWFGVVYFGVSEFSRMVD
jgi:hypothetical protein